jgi:hypothetical protein
MSQERGEQFSFLLITQSTPNMGVALTKEFHMKIATNPDGGLRLIDARPHLIADALPVATMCEINSIEEVAANYARWISEALTAFVSHYHPIGIPDWSTWVWMRYDGSVYAELISDSKYPDYFPEEPSRLLLEVFRCGSHASPSSSFYKRIPDENGRYVGHVAANANNLLPSWHGLKQTRDYSGQFQTWEALGFQRFRIAPMNRVECVAAYNNLKHTDHLRHKILRWMLAGHYVQLLQHLSLEGLRNALENHGATFGLTFGTSVIFEAVQNKLQEQQVEQGGNLPSPLAALA